VDSSEKDKITVLNMHVQKPY